MEPDVLLFVVLIFLTVFLLMAGLSMPVFGENRQARKRLKSKALKLSEGEEESELVIELRKNEFKGLSSWERAIESSQQLSGLRGFIAQAGHSVPAYRLIGLSGLLALLGAMLAWVFQPYLPMALLAGAVAAALPLLKIASDRSKRLARFDEQLPEAIDVMKRAVQAGHPFSESIHLVAEELEEPISVEFGRTFADLNYGNDTKRALLGLLHRVPSVNVMALVTSVLIQRETGGNLAEILGKLSSVIRQRFKFHRKLRTLSAEGRMSAWILCMVPFVLIGAFSLLTPDYLPLLLNSPMAPKLIGGAGIGMALGILWIRQIIRIEV